MEITLGFTNVVLSEDIEMLAEEGKHTLDFVKNHMPILKGFQHFMSYQWVVREHYGVKKGLLILRYLPELIKLPTMSDESTKRRHEESLDLGNAIKESYHGIVPLLQEYVIEKMENSLKNENSTDFKPV